MRRSSFLLLALLAVLVTACGASPAPSGTPGSGSPSSLPAPTRAVVPATTPGRTQLPCADLNVAWDSVRETLDLLSGLTSDDIWAAALAPDSPVKLDPDALDASIDQLAGLPGQSDTIRMLRALVPLYRAAVKSGKPFAESSGLGLRLLTAAEDASSLAKVEIPTVLEILGCTGV